MFYYPNLPAILRPDRILFVILVGMSMRAWLGGLLQRMRFGRLEFIMLLFTVLCFASLLLAGSNRTEGPGANTEINEVFNLTVYPFLTFLLARQLPYSRQRLHWFLVGMGVVTAYLGLTSWFERFDVNRLIFPSYIADMSMGTHQGRSRGPFLQAVFMGYCLVVGILCTYVLAGHSRRQSHRKTLIGVILVAVAGVYFTNTRGAWLALALGLLITSVIPSSIRRLSIGINLILFIGFLFSGASQFSLTGGNLFTKRQNTVEQRELNYRIAFHMGLDHPFFGVGFSRMGYEFERYFAKYYEGEEWQGWDGNHNEYLGLFAEVGMVAPLCYAYILGNLGLAAYRASRRLPQVMAMEAALAVSSVACLAGFALISYFNQVRAAPFHVSLTFFLAGLVASAAQASRRSAPEVPLPQ